MSAAHVAALIAIRPAKSWRKTRYTNRLRRIAMAVLRKWVREVAL